MNQRKFRRIEFRAKAVIHHGADGNACISGEVDNLCNRGIYIKTADEPSPLQVMEDTLVSVRFAEGPIEITVTMPAKVARTCQEGAAFHSPHISMYPLLHLEHLFIYRKNNPDLLTEDFCEYISNMPLPRSSSAD